jgi:hypothetical protein
LRSRIHGASRPTLPHNKSQNQPCNNEHPGYGAGWRKLESCTPRWSEWLGRDFSMSGRSRNALDLRAGDEQLHRLAALIADLEVTFKDYSIGLVD